MHSRSAVRNANDRYYTLTFPDPSAITDPNSADRLMQRSQSIKRTGRLFQPNSFQTNNPKGYFSIAGAVDGVADLLSISDDDEWAISSMVVEVKNRVEEISDPPPLHDKIQMAVYMKMLNVAEGDLVQFMHDEEIKILISRVSFASISDDSDSQNGLTAELWSGIVLPRLYQFTEAILKARADETLRLEFLAGSPEVRLAFLRRECAFFIKSGDHPVP